MDKNAIKKYAVWARRELIERVSQRAMIYGITAKNAGDPNSESVNGHLLSQKEKCQRQALIQNIKAKGYEQVMEEVAYTWFNRFAALRFMEVNGYLPSHIRVFTNDAGEFKPQILAEAIHLELDGLDMNKVYELESANKSEELFKYLLIVQCNALNSILPGMFQRIDDYTELLLPDYLLREGSVIEQMITVIPEDDWTDQVQIIGWLYQYYNTEPKDAVFSSFKKNKKVTKDSIPAATQLFTPDWIVHYMVENSLGRLWTEGHPNEALKSEWKYYLEETEQETEVQAQLKSIRTKYAALKPEDIRCIDPCMGSGHILCVLFDTLIRIYEDYGYTHREAVSSIVENNIWGLDIDERAAQLSYFAVMMKARQYDRRFFSRKVQPHIYAIEESNGLNYNGDYADLLLDNTQQEILNYMLDVFYDAKEYGSIIKVEKRDLDTFEKEWKQLADRSLNNLNLFEWYTYVREKILNIVHQMRALSQQYDIVVTNPPYMSNRNMGKATANYIQKHYKSSKNDMFAVFIEVVSSLTKSKGFYSMITQPSIITLSAFKKLRHKMITEQNFISLIHMGRGIFGIDFGSTAFVLRNVALGGYVSEYFKLFERTFQYIDPMDIEQIYINTKSNHEYAFDFDAYNKKNEETGEIEDSFEDIGPSEGRIFYAVKQEEFLEIPDNPFAYWMAPELIEAFSEKRIEDYATVTNGLFTCDNNRFLRLWHEVDYTNIFIDCDSRESNMCDHRRWYPYNKGGNYRKWYGNHEYVVDFRHFGRDISTYRVESGQSASFPGQDFYFQPSLSWSFISAAKFGIRYYPKGFVFDIAGSSVFSKKKDNVYQILALLGSEVVAYALQIINPTMNYQAGNVRQLPVYDAVLENREIGTLAKENINYAREDWDSFEVSWNFRRHPLCCTSHSTIKNAFSEWRESSNYRFLTVQENEKRINEILINIYRLEKYVKPFVDDKYITIQKANIETNIRGLISYAVGCMFGRYSLDVPGIAYAGGEWDSSRYTTFRPDMDAIIPICDDEYFEDDIVGQFVSFIDVVYGKDTREENLQFIAQALGGKGTSREVIRNYFINEFYTDHLKVYQKRPIYWLFDSGKKNGFKCLIYMHRYQPDTIARIRTDYVHEQQSRYRTTIAGLEQRIDGASTSERVKLSKQLSKLQAQAEEIRVYEEKIHHLADQMIKIDLDDGVKHNYEIFKDVLAKIK